MGFFDKLFGKKKAPRGGGLMGSEPKVIPESELALDANAASSLIAGAGMGGTKIGVSTVGKQVFFVTKQSLSPSDVNALRQAIEQGRVDLRLNYVEMPTYPVFAVIASIMDRPSDPFGLETFPNIAGTDKTLLQRLRMGGRLGIGFYFYGPNESLLFKAGYESLFLPNPDLGQRILKAEMYLESLPPSVRNYPAAVQQYIQENP